MFQVIPAIDLLDGKAVRLLQGRYDQVTVYSSAPAELAKQWREHTSRIHLVDLEGARSGTHAHAEAISEIISAFGPGVQVGGGVRSFDSAKRLFDLGAERVVVGTLAIREPAVLERLVLAYPNQVVVALDAKGGFVATDGWLDVSTRKSIDVANELAALPIAALLYTDIERDGTQVGPNLTETQRLAAEGGLPVIASGGVGSLAHLAELSAIAASGVVGAVVGRALHDGKFSLAEAIQAAKPKHLAE